MSATLRRVTAKLETVVEQAEADLARQFPDIDPGIVKDVNGRYVLLDAYVALVQAHAAMEASRAR